MIDVELKISKASVYDEVAKTTSYEGAKVKGDDSAYARIFTTDEDRLMLERFWVEACNAATELFKNFIVEVSEQEVGSSVDLSKDYDVKLEMSNRYDATLTGSMQASLFSYFVASVTGKWNKFTHQETVTGYEADAQTALEDVKSKLYYRKRPVRIVPA